MLAIVRTSTAVRAGENNTSDALSKNKILRCTWLRTQRTSKSPSTTVNIQLSEHRSDSSLLSEGVYCVVNLKAGKLVLFPNCGST